MVQVINGRQKQWVSLDFTGVPNPIAKEGVAQNEMVVVSQLRRAQQEEQTARDAAIAAVNAALADETQARIDGDTLAEQRLQQAIEGVSKRTVADRYEGVTAPTPADVPNVNTTLPADDWHSWFLWDQGTESADTGIYYFVNGIPTRVPTVEMAAGLLTYVDDENTFWLMIDDPTGGTSDFVPFGRSSDLGSTPPVYTTANTIRLAFESGWLATRVNPDTGETELTIAQSFRDRVSNLEVDVDDLQARTTTIEGEQVTQNTAIATERARNDGQDTAITGLTTRVTTAEADIDNLETRATTIEGNVSSLTTRVTITEGDIDSLETRTTTIEGEQVTQNNRLTTTEGNITTLTNRVTTAEGDIDSLEARVGTAEGEIDVLQGDVATIQQQQVTQDSAIATERTRNDGQDTAIADLQTTKQTAQQVLDAIAAQFRLNNPIKTLVNGVVTQVQQAGATYTQTTFTVELGQVDFARTRFSENAAPFAAIAPPDETYPGTTYVVSFLGMPGEATTVMNADGSVKSGVIDVWFHKGFR